MPEPEDWTDRHVARWRDHWVDVRFDDETEAVVTRLQRLVRHLSRTGAVALAESGLQDFEYRTLHQLMIRDTPGVAGPGELAEDLGLSGAGMTGRLDTLEQAGWVQRRPAPDDRRRVVVEVTREGAALWRSAIARRGETEHELLAPLDPAERSTLAALLKKLTLAAEAADSAATASSPTTSEVSG